MILTLDVGNTSIKAVLFDGKNVAAENRAATYTDDYNALLKPFLQYEITSTGMSTVVPAVKEPLTKAVKDILGADTILLKVPELTAARSVCGLTMGIDNPETLGSDLLCDVVAASKMYPLPAIIADTGTVTKILAVSKDSVYMGGALFPGIRISLEVFSAGAALLSNISVSDTAKPVGTNTADCMSGGVICGTACMIDEMTRRYEEILGKSTLVFTGGHSGTVIPHCRREYVREPHLVNLGILYLLGESE